MHRIIRTKAYEAEHGPHFNEEHARKAVSKMENEDGSRGQHWSIEETTALANQHGIRLDDKFNKYDWYVALNMVYSDYYIVTDNSIGLTVATDKQQIINMVKATYDEYKAKKEAMVKYDEEMVKCEGILKQLDFEDKEPEKEDPRIQELQNEVKELKDLIKQASSMVPPQMKQMLPQNMRNAMNEAS